MNSVSRKSLDWHPYKSAGHPCSLACLLMICSLLDVNHVTHKKHRWLNCFFCLSWKATSICTEDVKYADNVQQYFRQENNKGLLFTMSWSGRLCSCSWSRLSQEMLSLEWSDADWGSSPPSPQAFIISSSLYKWHIWCHGPPRRGRWFLTLASPRYV